MNKEDPSHEYLCALCRRIRYNPNNNLLLTHREVEVANKVLTGLANKEIATQLFVTEKTVKFHLTTIYKKLGFVSRFELISECIRNPKILTRTKNQGRRSQTALK